MICSEDTRVPESLESAPKEIFKGTFRQQNTMRSVIRLSLCCFASVDGRGQCCHQIFSTGSAGGPNSVSSQHRDLLSDPELLEKCTYLTILLSGGLPQPVSEIIYGGRLTALHKKDYDITPIAVGFAWRRLAAMCANEYALNKMAGEFSPIQLGAGTPGGAEAAIHATRRNTAGVLEGHIMVKLDFSNAFNTLR